MLHCCRLLKTRMGLIALAVLLLIPAHASLAAPVVTPTSLNPGDTYRLAFVTSTTRDATSTNIADYNAFVTSVANTVAQLAALNTTWTAIGSTASVAARDNTGTNPFTDPSAPIFLLNDTKLADDNLDLWNGNVDIFLDVDENGDSTTQTIVHSGTTSSGVSRGNLVLGETQVGSGRTTSNSFAWIAASPEDASDLFAFYAISAPIVVPEPATALLMGGGLVVFGWARRRSA